MNLSKISLIGAVAALALAGTAQAQVTLPIVTSLGSGDVVQVLPNAQTRPTNVYATTAQLRSFALGQGLHSGAPTLTTTTSICGGALGVVNGTDVSGQITEGTTNSTSCVVTFATAFVTAPECFVSINNVTDASLKCATSTTTLTITKSSTNSSLINYLVVGLTGG